LKEKTILIVENYPDLARAFTLVLQKNGYSTDKAKSTMEALEKIRKNRYSAVLIDDEPPEIDTATLLLELNKHNTTKIVITDYPEKAATQGAHACLNKIVKMDQLLLLLKTR
jgi:CheY-like chemotaxis protein